MKILVLNSGSSSLKYKVIEMPEELELVSGRVERIGESGRGAKLTHVSFDEQIYEEDVKCAHHLKALIIVLKIIADKELGCVKNASEIAAVGHRVVHGKDVFSEAVLVDEKIISTLKEFIELAPLHMPANIACVEACGELLESASQVAYFDTAFYQTMPKHATLYAVPREWSEKYGVRRYGFHGTSHQYVTHAASETLGIPLDKLKLITAHLGNGASITAFKKNKVVETSMGFTPLEGLIMGTRCGYLDPAVVSFICEKTGATAKDVEKILNNESGVAAISGIGRDMRNILDARADGNDRADLAFKMYTHTLRKYIGAYFATLGGCDAIVFTAGIGENCPEVRAAACENLSAMGIEIDDKKNAATVGGKTDFINAPGSRVKVMVIPTNEELLIARETYKITGKSENN